MLAETVLHGTWFERQVGEQGEDFPDAGHGVTVRVLPNSLEGGVIYAVFSITHEEERSDTLVDRLQFESANQSHESHDTHDTINSFHH